jgi:protein-tyrosine phosphatase
VSNWFRTYGFADVHERLVIGAYPLDGDDVELLSFLGIERVLNLVQDDEYHAHVRTTVEAALAARQIEERRLTFADFGHLPSETLEQAVVEVNEWIDHDHRVYVHCRAGWQRSAAVAAGVVAIREGIDVDEALALVQSRKPSADPLPHQREDLRTWWRERQSRVAPTLDD